MIDGDISAQTRRVLEEHRRAARRPADCLTRVVRTTVFLADMNDFAAMNEVYRTFFRRTLPARSTVQAARLPRDARIEIDVIASCESDFFTAREVIEVADLAELPVGPRAPVPRSTSSTPLTVFSDLITFSRCWTSLISTVRRSARADHRRRYRLPCPDVGVDVGDLRADRREHPFPVLNLHRQLHRVGAAARRRSFVPLDFDPALRVVKKIDDIRTGRRMDRHTFAARDVSDNFLAADRIAAARPNTSTSSDPRTLIFSSPPPNARLTAAATRRPAASREGGRPAQVCRAVVWLTACHSRSARIDRRRSRRPRPRAP